MNFYVIIESGWKEVDIMSVRKSKPYSTPKRTVKRKNDNANKNFDVTTRIRVDEVRLNDSDSLDTSFLEGRVERQSKKDTKKVKEKILKDNSVKIKYLNTIKRFLFGIALITCIILLVVYLVNFIKSNHIFENNTTKTNKDNTVEKTDNINTKKEIDDNFLLVGDFYTDKFDLDEYDLDYHYVKRADKKLTTSKLIDDMGGYIYKYNPSIVFLQIGINDLNDKKSIEEIVENYEKIIDLIQEKRSYADICIESLIPINRDAKDFDEEFFNKDLDNEDIKELNSKLKDLANRKDIVYIDLYSMLENDGKLDEKFTSNGIYLNEDGYKQVLKMIKKYTTKD